MNDLSKSLSPRQANSKMESKDSTKGRISKVLSIEGQYLLESDKSYQHSNPISNDQKFKGSTSSSLQRPQNNLKPPSTTKANKIG